MNGIPKDYASIFHTSPCMFPRSICKLSINRRCSMTLFRGSQPRIDDQTRACIQSVGLARSVGIVEAVEKSCGGDLGRLLTGRPWADRTRRRRVGRHSIRHCKGLGRLYEQQNMFCFRARPRDPTRIGYRSTLSDRVRVTEQLKDWGCS